MQCEVCVQFCNLLCEAEAGKGCDPFNACLRPDCCTDHHHHHPCRCCVGPPVEFGTPETTCILTMVATTVHTHCGSVITTSAQMLHVCRHEGDSVLDAAGLYLWARRRAPHTMSLVFFELRVANFLASWVLSDTWSVLGVPEWCFSSCEWRIPWVLGVV